MIQTDLGHGRGWLDEAAAASIARIDAELGHAIQITEAGRTWAQQDVHYQHYLKYGSPIALSPDAPSVHQEGEAIDSDEAQKHIELMARHGWKRTVYRNKKLVEPWHFEYFASSDQHRNDPTPTTTEEDDDMRIFSTTDGSFYLAKPGGIVGIRSIPDLQLLRRLLNSKTGAEDRFNARERDIIDSYLRG